MNHLQTYLRLRDITAADIAEATGLGYHAVQKTIKGLRKGREVRQAIADYLQLPYDHIWGVRAPRRLKGHLIPKAIAARAQNYAQAEQRRLEDLYTGVNVAGNKHAING